MPPPVTKHSARLKRLEAARQKLIELPRGTVLTSEPMARLLGMRWPALRDMCDTIEGFEDSGAFERGSNGLKYEFCPVRTLWFLIDHFRAMAESEVAKADRVNAMIMGPDAAAARGIDLDDMRKILDLRARLDDARERSGELIDAKAVATTLNHVFSRMQEVALTAPQELDPAGQWEPQVRAHVDRAMQTVLLRQRAAARDAVKTLRTEGT